MGRYNIRKVTKHRTVVLKAMPVREKRVLKNDDDGETRKHGGLTQKQF